MNRKTNHEQKKGKADESSAAMEEHLENDPLENIIDELERINEYVGQTTHAL